MLYFHNTIIFASHAYSPVGVAVCAAWFTTSLYLCLKSGLKAVMLPCLIHPDNNHLFGEYTNLNEKLFFPLPPLLCNTVFSGQRCGFWTITTVTSQSITLRCLTCPSPSSPRRCLHSRSTTWGKVR